MSQNIKTVVELNQFAGNDFDVVRSSTNARKIDCVCAASNEVHTFDTVKQCLDFIQLEKARNTPITLEQDTKQGGDSIKVDTSKLLLVQCEIKSPRPSSVKDPATTKQLRALAGKDAFDAVVDQLAYFDNAGKKQTRPELKKVSIIRNEWKRFFDEHSLNISMNGSRVVSIHNYTPIKQKVEEVNDALAKQANVITSKLEDWKAESISNGSYVDGKFPSATYFKDYGIKIRPSVFGDSFDYSDEVNDVKDEVISSLAESIETTLSSIEGFISGDKKKFRENSLVNLYESANRLKDGGFIDSEKFDTICESVSEFAKNFDAEAIRKSSKKVANGVKAQTFAKSGNVDSRRIPVTQDDIDKEAKKLKTVCDPLKELAAELDGLI